MEETTDDVKRKMTPSVPANYVSILQLRERWIKEKERKQRKEQEEAKDEERRRNQHAEEQQTIGDDLKKPREDLDEMRLNQTNQKHWGRNTKRDESTEDGEAGWPEEEEETAAIGSERGEDEGLPEKKKRGRRNRKKKRTNQEVEENKKITTQEVQECGSIKPLEYTVKESNTPVKDQIRVYRKKENKSVAAIETQFEHLSIKRGQETKHLKAQTKSLNPNPIETATMVWVKKGQEERAGDGNGSGVKTFNA
ncbi:BnaA05g11720D [Brassica napus]|uniref:BnaA05g11720D protein n=1 Tax=Brassica napus TaxID=3708 RepID=A0A078FCW4_BRANA|nr:BnaA05g11720D [Brassica napus]